MNQTMAKFGFPGTKIAQVGCWGALVRPNQVTLGAVVLVCEEDATALSAVSAQGISDFGKITKAIEIALKGAFNYDKINYLLLMMVDPDVHFHVIPRYASEREFSGQVFRDSFWPKPPDITVAAPVSADMLLTIRDHIRSHWPQDKA